MGSFRFPFAVWVPTLISLAACQTGGGAGLAHREDCREPIAIRQGSVAGRSAEQGTCSWKGIPYADSGPAYRFRRPGPAPTWTGVREKASCALP